MKGIWGWGQFSGFSVFNLTLTLTGVPFYQWSWAPQRFLTDLVKYMCAEGISTASQFVTGPSQIPSSWDGAYNVNEAFHINLPVHPLVDGSYSSWYQVSPCTRSCGGGTARWERKCNNPSAKNGGRQCQGPAVDIRTCANTFCTGMFEDIINIRTKCNCCTLVVIYRLLCTKVHFHLMRIPHF